MGCRGGPLGGEGAWGLQSSPIVTRLYAPTWRRSFSSPLNKSTTCFKCAASAALSKRKLHFTTFPRGQTWKSWKELRLASLHQWVACFLWWWWRTCSYRRALLDLPSGSVVKNLLASAGTQVPSLVREDPTCLRKAKPTCHSHWRSCALEARAQWQEKPPPWEAHTPQLEKSLRAVTKSQWNTKINKEFFLRKIALP